SVLLISPWNYPVYLTFGPLVGAIAAGCTAVIKPSEVAPHSAKLMTELIPRYLDTRAYIVINGAAHETTKLLEYKWDHIFYTGNGTVAKIIMKAAAQHLTPLTLELGGKSPAFVDENANMDVVAKRIAFGKTFNAGQAVETSRQTFKSGYTKPLKFRRHQLQQFWRLLDENTDAFIEAVHKDLRKHKNETTLGEIIPTKEEINDALEHLDEWAKDEVVNPSLVNKFGTTCLKRKEPK
ncbi:hypothetical protein BGX21_006726, partial [Mortierella sp. AD011]